MGALTEREIFARMSEGFKTAAQCCEQIAARPAAGPTYDRLRRELKILEGCCRQAAYWREDARWLPLGLQMEEAHRRAGDWLRRHAPRPLFKKLAANLREGQQVAEALRDKRPPHSGLILPKPQRDPTERNAHILVPKMPDTIPTPGGALLGSTSLSKTRLVMP